MLIVGLIPTSYHGTLDVGDDGEGARNVALKLGNGRMGVLDVPTNVENDYICVNRKFGLETDSQ